MNTPIRDFVKKYAESDTVRFHMPGHKGKSFLGIEKYDITEINGADVLYSANGIIKQSEENASKLFGTYKTYYSTEGSSLCIKAMLALVLSDRKSDGRPLILAGRNAHKAFIYSCALLDADVEWLFPENRSHICSCDIKAESVRRSLEGCNKLPDAVYVTSPDYLGHVLDIKSIADVCNEFSVPLIVDNAHGAYLHFLKTPQHPIDLGAYMCCDSAHKTFPVLTGGAYLHLSERAGKLSSFAENMLSVFASTSPSYLILQSLDVCNSYLNNNYPSILYDTVIQIDKIKNQLSSMKYFIEESEPLKLVVNTVKSELEPSAFIRHLRNSGIEVEFYDDNYIVFMFSCENTEFDFNLLINAFSAYDRKQFVTESKAMILPVISEKKLSIRNAVFSQKETVSVSDSIGRICACPTVSCPPAVPITVSGEVITERAVESMILLGIKEIEVVK